MKVGFSQQFFCSNIKFHENPFGGTRVPYGQTDWRTDMTKLIVALHNFANALKYGKFVHEKCDGESDSLFQIACNYFCAPVFALKC